MPKTIHRLTAVELKNAKTSGLYPDGAGLYLKVAGSSKSWVFRYMLDGRARYLGLGSALSVPLAEAQSLAAKARELLRLGIDPIEHRQRERAQTRLAGAREMSFQQCAEAHIASHERAWKNAKHRQQWKNTFATYVYPVLGEVPVGRVDTDMVLKVLEPIWSDKPETASRLRGRIEAVLDSARARGARDGENPARWRGHLANLLPKHSRVARVRHYRAMAFAELPTFVKDLAQRTDVAAKALEFLILTASRTGEVLGARWEEVDLNNRVWTIPIARMKGGREHRVPLATRVILILKEMCEIRSSDFVFPGIKQGQPLSNMSLLMLLRRMGRQVTAHGFRSSFRDWAAETTPFPNFVVEMSLAHAIADKTEAAYRRGDLLAKRRRLMEAWANYCGRVSADIVRLNRQAAPRR